MRLLFEIDTRDYAADGRGFFRDSSRGIVIRKGKVAMVHSLKYDYYKFPGGGIEKGESAVDALIRETREESGLNVIPESVREYGYVHRVQSSDMPDFDYFVQDNFYYLCDAESELSPQELDGYEFEERFTLEFVAPRTAIEVNRRSDHGPKDQLMLEREARVLETLIDEGYFINSPDFPA